MNNFQIGNTDISSGKMGNLNFSITVDFVSGKSTINNKDIWLLLDAFAPLYAICNPRSSKETRDVFSYILGELLENVAKFSNQKKQKGNMVAFYDYDNAFKLELTNISLNNQTKKFQSYLNELASNDLDTIMKSKFEYNFKNPTENKSEVGILNILTSYESTMTVNIVKMDSTSSQICIEMMTPKGE
jgi:hypothetical protein